MNGDGFRIRCASRSRPLSLIVRETPPARGEFDCRGQPAKMGGSTWIAECAYLIGMSITAHPASLEAQALGVMPGDIRRTPDRSGWPISFGWHAPLLERAVAKLPPRGETRARRIFGPHDAGHRLDLEHRTTLDPAEIEAAQWEPKRPPGRLRRSAPFPGIISVR